MHVINIFPASSDGTADFDNESDALRRLVKRVSPGKFRIGGGVQ